MNLFILYLEFFKTGLFAAGGGLATLPFLFKMADKYEWLNHETVGNFLAIAQSSPGPIGVNMAVLCGFRAAGITGGIIAAAGIVSPAIIVIIILSVIMKSFKENKIAVSVFSGLRPASLGLLASAFFLALKLALYVKDAPFWHNSLRVREGVILLIIFAAILKLKGHPVIYIAIGAAVGILLRL
ncbi:MAG: chromate transporter [Treponema sp.]|nr:chromate transporter [Treponema sp.]